MIDTLPLFHRVAGQPVIVLGEGEAAEAKRRLVERAGGRPCGEDESGARLAFIALESGEAEPEAAAARLRSRGILVNVVDRPELCDFVTPAILDRSPVLLAVGTGGASAGLAKALRLRLEALLPPGLGAMARALGAAREALRQHFPDAGERRRVLDAALTTGGPLDPLGTGAGEGAVARWLAATGEGIGSMPAGVVEIRLRSADPDDLTLREARLLGSADLILHEAQVPPVVLDRARADAPRRLLGKGMVPAAVTGLTVIVKFRAKRA